MMATKIVDVRIGAQGGTELPSTHKVVHVDYTDPENGRQYGGDFTLKRMTLGDIRRAAIRRAQLNGGLPENVIQEDVQFLNTCLAHLEGAIVASPEWWKPEELYNGRVIFDLYSEVMRFEETFRPAVRKGAHGASTASSPAVGIGGAPPQKVVVPQVQPSADG